MKSDERWMRLAIDKAREGIADGQAPFGACIVKEGSVIACAHNIVWKTIDITAHAEIHAIRSACQALQTIDLSGCEMYSTCEPCPMCFSAIHWARIDKISYGASIMDAQQAGFHELHISNQKMKQESGSPLTLVGQCCHDECVALFDRWKQEAGRAY